MFKYLASLSGQRNGEGRIIFPYAKTTGQESLVHKQIAPKLPVHPETWKHLCILYSYEFRLRSHRMTFQKASVYQHVLCIIRGNKSNYSVGIDKNSVKLRSVREENPIEHELSKKYLCVCDMRFHSPDPLLVKIVVHGSCLKLVVVKYNLH